MFKRLWNKYWPWAVIRNLRTELAQYKVTLINIQNVINLRGKSIF